MRGRGFSRFFRRRQLLHAGVGSPTALFGYFEFRAGRISGWVRDTYNSEVSKLWVEVLYDGNVIASVTATVQADEGRFAFSVPVEGRFSGADLVKERVIVLARDSDGNSGRILLDGAGQLELVREYFGAPAAVIFDLDFGPGGNARPFLGRGWSGPDVDFTFTEDSESFISFDRPVEPGSYALRITTGALVRKPEIPEQELVIFVDDTQIGHISLTEPHVQFRECLFSHEAFGSAASTTLRLYHPDAKRPCDFGWNSDVRRLAFSFKRLSLARLIPPE